VEPALTIDPQLAKAQGGDRKALEAIVARLLPRVRNLVRYLVRGDADAEDIAQEALVAIVRGLPGHRGEGSLESWADRIVARVTFAALRRSRQAQQKVEEGAELELVPDPGGRPSDYAERRRAVALLDQLPEEQRQALVLHHVLGLSAPEIAVELEVPFETVRSRLRLGMQKLRALHEGEP
jgi:RNA polymerase sigma-70 factor, ECF subfamily